MSEPFGNQRARQIAEARNKCKCAFLRKLASGQPVAFEDAIRSIETPGGYDRRGLSVVVIELMKDGRIERAGYRQSRRPDHHGATKRLWKLKGGV